MDDAVGYQRIDRHISRFSLDINPSNSCGSLLNDQSQAIAISTVIIQWAQRIGFAIPNNKCSRLLTSWPVL